MQKSDFPLSECLASFSMLSYTKYEWQLSGQLYLCFTDACQDPWFERNAQNDARALVSTWFFFFSSSMMGAVRQGAAPPFIKRK